MYGFMIGCVFTALSYLAGNRQQDRNVASLEKAMKKESTSLSSQSSPTSHNGTVATYTTGRPAWFDVSGKKKEAYVIGLTGGSGSGKTTVAQQIIKMIKVPWVTVLSMDSFYKQPDDHQRRMIERGEFNFDHPDAVDFDLCIKTLKKLKQGRQVDVPIYNFVTHSREKRTKRLYGANIIVFEGILAFFKQELVDLMDLRVFVDTDSDSCLSRRIRRDTRMRGRTVESTIEQYCMYVKPAFDKYVLPTMPKAHVIVPRGVTNIAAMRILLSKVKFELSIRGFKLRNALMARPEPKTRPVPDSSKFHLLEETSFVRHAVEVMRYRTKCRSFFEVVRFRRRLLKLLLRSSLRFNQPAGGNNDDEDDDDGPMVCAITIIRDNGVADNTEFDDVLNGQITIGTNVFTNEHELHYIRLPEQVQDMKTLIVDTSISTGAAAMMAIRTLLDHGVVQSEISLLSCSISARGYSVISTIYPEIVIFTAEFDVSKIPVEATDNQPPQMYKSIQYINDDDDDDDDDNTAASNEATHAAVNPAA